MKSNYRADEVGMKNRLGLLALLALASVACGVETPDSTQRGFEAWDSAGITISMSPDSTWVDETRWRVATEPSVVIGTLEGDDPHTVFGRIGGVGVLSDGRIVVADGHASEIRVFDSDGLHLTTLGGRGKGPGEFENLWGFATIAGDTIVIRDGGAFNQIYFAPDGSGSRTVLGPPPIWNDLFPVHVVGWLPDGSAVITTSVQRSEYPPGTNLVTAPWHLFDPLGNHQAFIGQLPDVWAHNEGEGKAALVFSPRAVIQPDGSGFWHGFPEKVELVHHTADGVDRIIRTGYEPPVVTAALRDAFRARSAESTRLQVAEGVSPDQRRVIRARDAELQFVERLPAYQRFLISADGYFWLESYYSVGELSDPSLSRPDRSGPVGWTVLSPEGEWLGTIEIPAGLSLRTVTEDRIVGVMEDEVDVQYVFVFELEKPNQVIDRRP
jgi:hypothetical protein